MTEQSDQGRAQSRTRAPKAARREQLIEATIDSIARKGLAAVTLADVADGAGLSRGIVNFHFESKEKLLHATLSHLSQEYDRRWQEELGASGEDPATRLRALILGDFAESVCQPRKLAAWFAFFGEAASRPDYRDLCLARDDCFMTELEAICAKLEADEGYGIPAKPTALAIYAMQEGLWLRMMLGPQELARGEAISIAFSMIHSLFPRHFEANGDVIERA